MNPKYAEHGETLAMKGLTLNCLGRKEEAYEYVRKGLRNDLKSHVCWHVYGLLQRSDKKYDEAIKCYRNALKWEKDNIQILRDLSLLQIQMRDMEGYRETRYQLLMLRPTQRTSWIGYALSYHLLEDYMNALKILETFLDQQPKGNLDYEHSELILYQNMVVQESGDLQKALDHLEKNSDAIVDKLTLKENLGSLNLRLKKFETAAKIYEELIKRNPENTLYYKKLIESKQLTDPEEVVKFYVEYAELFPRAMPPKRLPLNYASGDVFKNLVDKYMRKGLSKGVPPLFVDLRSLYTDKTKVEIIESLMMQYVDALKKCGKYNEGDTANGPKEPASALLWVYYFLAQHYDYLDNTEKALNYIDDAIEHTPTLIELFVTKGRIYKHAGDPQEAYKWLDEAQALDTADRYINSKCAKYMLRANHVKEAEETCAKFTREGVSAMENLNEMQCMWFQTECALAYQRLAKYGEALKKCHEVDRHFSEIIEDQFDFHTYCMRKMTLRSYVGLLRLEDVLRGHPFYFKAARCAIEVYLHLFDAPLKDESAEQELNTENLAPSELKKLRNKQRKARKKAEQESAQAAQAQVKKDQHHKCGRGDVEPDAPQLDELIPDKLARVDDPLEQAIKFLQPLQMLANDRIETHLMAFEVYFRKGKVLLMLQSIKRARKLDLNNSMLHTCIIRFLKFISDNKVEWDPAVDSVLKSELKAHFNNEQDATKLNHQFLETYGDRLESVLEGGKMSYYLDKSSRSRSLDLVLSLDNKYKDVNIKNCNNVLGALRKGDFGDCAKEMEDYVARCNKAFPYCASFQKEKTVENNHIQSENALCSDCQIVNDEQFMPFNNI